MSRPRILALDLSLVATGWCLPDGTTGRIDGTKLRGVERIDHIARQVQALARGVDLVVIEGYSFGSKGSSVFNIAELGGGVRLLLYRLGLPFIDVPPSTLKKWATGRGNCGKDEMIAAAIRRFTFAGSTNDEADAYLLWAMARHAYGAPLAELPKVQADVLTKVRWPGVD